MNTVIIDKKGQIIIPRAILERLGIEGEQILLVVATDDGAILLRPAGACPVELYSQERIEEFLDEDALPASLEDQAHERLNEALR